MTVSLRQVSFYFAAHQDDWQLFMNPPAFGDTRDPATKCVFVHLTAGDAGLGMGSAERRHPLYLAREAGARAAIRFMADPDWEAPADETAASETIDGHAIHCVRYRNTAAYFLRLPDGSPAGTGYAETGNRSLQRLAESRIDEIAAIDGSATYRGWQDLVTTLRVLVARERENAPAVHLHFHDPDADLNPDDHADHYMTGKAALAAAQGIGRAQCTAHLGYAAMKRPENLSLPDRDRQNAVYAVTLAAVAACDHPTAWAHYDAEFIGRGYSRILPAGEA
ncbi:MAG: hypothetical protein ACK4UO_10840 [Pseudolabrys sp.]